MSLETYTGKIADMVVTNPQPTDPKSQGDDHLRGIKYTLQQSFPGFDGPLNATRVPFTPAGNIAATNVQAAIAELDSETQAGLATKVSKSGDTMTGKLYLKHPAGESIGLVWKGTDDTTVGYFYRDLATGSYHLDMRNNVGTTNGTVRFDLSGYIAVSGAQPPVSGSLTRKDYVDGAINTKITADWITHAGLNANNILRPYFRRASDGAICNLPQVYNATDLGYIGGTGGPLGISLNGVDFGGTVYGIFVDATSDVRLKENITKTDVAALDVINSVELVQFDYKQEVADWQANVGQPEGVEKISATERHVRLGVIAQQLIEVIPEAVSITKQQEGSALPADCHNVVWQQMVPYLAKAIQELSTKLDSAMAEIAALKAAK